MKKLLSHATVLAFFGIVTMLFVVSMFYPKHAVSMTENRNLAQRPVNDLTDLRALTENWADYVVDQFPFRERLLKVYSALELAQDKRLTRNTYITEDGWLMTRIYPVSEGERLTFVWAIDSAARNTEPDFVYAVLPQKNDMLSELAEPYVDNSVSVENKAALLTEMEKATEVKTLDVGGYLLETYSLKERMQMYYRTDFHWNSYGAFLAAQYIGEEMAATGLLDGVTLPTSEDFHWEELGEDHLYCGDLNRRLSYLLSMHENIPNYSLRDAAQVRYYRSVDDSVPVEREEIVGSGLAEDCLNYNGISTANLSYYRVVNPNARSAKHVLILKDSYQNPTIDYFTELFAEVAVIDPRYYSEPYSFSEILEQNDIDIVLLMYHQNNHSIELSDFFHGK